MNDIKIKLVRMRTIEQAYSEIKVIDPYTALTHSGLKRIVKEGCIPSKKVGRKTLLNMMDVYAYLNDGEAERPKQYGDDEYGKIRPVF